MKGDRRLKKGIKSIDIHAHIIPPTRPGKKNDIANYRISQDSLGRDILIIEGRKPYAISKQLFDVDLRIKEMDETKVDMQFLSIMPPLIQYKVASHKYVGHCQKQNDDLAEVARANPRRFVGLANVPLQAPAEAAQELERAITELKMCGAQITTDINGKYLDSPDLRPFYERAQALGAFILYHPNNPPGMEAMQKYQLHNLVGLPFTTSLTIAGLIFGGVLRDFPELKICFAHAGGAAPYLIGRWDHGHRVRPECSEFISESPYKYFKQMYFDTVTHNIPALEYLIETVGSDKILLGSDYPFDMADPNPVATVAQVKSITASEKRKILSKNIISLLDAMDI